MPLSKCKSTPSGVVKENIVKILDSSTHKNEDLADLHLEIVSKNEDGDVAKPSRKAGHRTSKAAAVANVAMKKLSLKKSHSVVVPL